MPEVAPETEAPEYSGSATYCPEDNKLRLYVGRVPRDEYLQLRAEGWTATPKQREAGGCDFVAPWSPARRDTALRYAGIIEDEDMSPQDRAADRAERFSGYREKRLDEATGHADRYDAGPQFHGYQDRGRAVRAADRHDRIAGRAVDSWEKAEYWQRRTAGVISHALHVSSPAVRMGRIKELEAEIRRVEKARAEYAARREKWVACAAMEDPEAQNAAAAKLAYYEHGDFTHPRTGRKSYLYDFIRPDENRNPDPLTGAEICALWLADNGPLAPEGDWLTHYRLRLAYENQMLEAQGGRAAFVEMEVGGWIGNRQIRKVNKSPATGRVVSVTLKIAGDRWGNSNEGFHLRAFNVERMPQGAYRPPSDEDRASLAAEKKAEKAAAPKKDPCPLVNPTDEDAERLQAIWNETARRDFDERNKRNGYTFLSFKPSTVCRITQAIYSAASKGAHARAETRGLCRSAKLEPRFSSLYNSAEVAEKKRRGPAVCQVRTTGSDGSDYGARRVIVLTDKPQKPLPAAVWEPIPQQSETVNA